MVTETPDFIKCRVIAEVIESHGCHAKHRVGDRFVMTAGGQLIAILVLKQPGDNQMLLDNIAVDPACQGKGLGSRLLVFAEARAMALQYPCIDLHTHALMVENQALYARRDYKETARRREQGFDRVYMRKMLTL